MPQDPQNPQVPGSDVLLDTLRSSKISDQQRQQMWDAYTKPKDEKSFVDSLRGLPVNDDVRQNLYDMRFKGWKNSGNTPPTPEQSQAASPKPVGPGGDVRPSNADVSTWSKLKNEASVAVGNMVPDAAVPALQAVDKYAVKPFDRMAEAGSRVGGAVGQFLLTGGMNKEQQPIASGIGQGVGELVGGTVADPRMWPFALEGAAKGALSQLAAKGFSGQMLYQAATTIPVVRDAIKSGDWQNAARLMTVGAGSGALGVLGMQDHSAAPSGQEQVAKAQDKINTAIAPEGRREGSDRSLNQLVKTATPMGPTSQTGGQQLHLDFASKAPVEATAPHITAENASRSAGAPIIDRQALIAPEPQGFSTDKAIQEGYAKEAAKPIDRRQNLELRQAIDKLKDSPNEALQHFQAAAELARAKDPSGGFKVSQDSLGIRWAEDSNGIRVSVPKSIADADIQEYAKSKIAEQTKMQADIKAKVPEAPKPEPVKTMNPAELHGVFDKISDLSRQSDLAENDEHAQALLKQHRETETATRDLVRTHLTGQPTADVANFRDQSLKEAAKAESQAKAIRDLTEATIKNRGVQGEITDFLSQGGPFRTIVDPETGERINAKPPEKAGIGTRSVLNEMRGRVPSYDLNDLEVTGLPKGVNPEEGVSWLATLQAERKGLIKKISDAVTIASDTGSSIEDFGLEEHAARLKEIESDLGRYTKKPELDKEGNPKFEVTGRRPNKPAELDSDGAIKAPEPLKSWSLERARLAISGKLRTIPTDEEFFQHADARQEKGRLFRTVADDAQKLLDRRKTQGGFAGEAPSNNLADYHKLVPSDDEMLKRAEKAGYRTWKPTEDNPAGVSGWLSKDGKSYIDKSHIKPQYTKDGRPVRIDHLDIAAAVLPDVPWLPKVNADRVMRDKGWIKKAGPTEYEAWNLDSTTKNTIEMDLMYKGKWGNTEAYITTRAANGRLQSLTLDRGYTDFKDALTQAKAKAVDNPEMGAVRGTTLMGSSAVGGVVGSVVGAHLGHPFEGAAVGWGLGFVTPAIADRIGFWRTVNAIGPRLAKLGVSAQDWLTRPKQLDVNDRDMQNILDAQQRDVKGPTKALLTRVAQLPGDIQHKMFDKFVFISDRPGAISNFLMKFDDRGRYFRDLRGKLDVDNSPYVSAWIAAGGGGGMAEAHLLDYKNMYKDAQSAGLVDHLNKYLNLKGYQRVYDVMQERIQEADQNIQKYKQALQQPNLPVEVEAGIRRELRRTTAERQDVIDKVTSKTLVPQPYDPPTIAKSLADQQQTLGSQFGDVKALADRVFALNRKVLDMAHDAGIVGDSDYQKYTNRGDEYIPMHRILEQVADNTLSLSSSPNDTSAKLYLRQQNVIKALMGSDRINRDPVIASADANLAAMREVVRNGVIRDYLKVAQADPQGVGSYFKQVQNGYKAKPGEGLVGFYQDGIQHTFATPEWLSESLKASSPAAMDVLGKGTLQTFAHILRQGATMGNLAWSLPNAVRHFADMAIMSDAGLKDIRTLPKDAAGLLRDWTKSVYGAVTQDSMWQEYMRSGAAYSTLQRMISPEDHLNLDTLGFKQKVAKGRVIDMVQDFNAAVEDATKMTTYRRLREAGYSEKNAAWETRRYGGGPDFAKQGNLTPAVNLASMFFNAHLQYVSRVFARAAENPARIAVALGAITAMAMTLNEHNVQQKDEKGNQLLRKVPYTDRENNFVVLTGDTYQSSSGATLPVYYKVPKPSFVKFLYNPIENMLNKVAGNEERSGTQLGLQALGNLSPGQMDLQEGQVGASATRGVVSSLNPVMRAPLEEAMNYKTTGLGGPIVPGRETGIDSQYQYGPGTSQTARQIGEGGVRGAIAGGAAGATAGYLLAGPKGAALGGALGGAAGSFGISPRRAEHVIDTTTAGVGRMATGFTDPFLGAVKQTHMEGPEKLANTPVAGPVLGRFVSTSMDQQEQNLTNKFYQDTQAAQQPLNTLRFLTKNHPEQVPAYIQAHQDDLWKGRVATNMQSRLSQILDAEKQIQNNQQMTDSDRTDALKNLHEVKMQVLSVFTKVLKPSPQVPQASAYPGQGQGAPH